MNMIKTGSLIAGILTLTLSYNAIAETSQEKGYNIMEAIEALPSTERSLSENIFRIYDATGNLAFTKKARSASFTMNYKEPKKRIRNSISYFYSPADDKGNSALMLEKLNEDDDQWLYLKGLRKPKRVLGSDKSSSFMGSDFSNGDLSPPELDEATYNWLGSETISFKNKNIPVEKIEVQFKDAQKREDYGYSKTILWIHPQSGMAFKGEIYDLQGQLFKKMELQSFKVVKNKDGQKVFTPTGMEMRNVLKGTRTEMEVTNLRTAASAANVSPDIFSLQYMTRKWW